MSKSHPPGSESPGPLPDRGERNPADPGRVVQAEPLRVESESQTGRKRATQAPSPTGQTETPPASAKPSR